MRSTATVLALLVVLAGCHAAEPIEPPAGNWTPLGLQVQDLPDSARTALGVTHGVMVTKVRAPANRTRILPGDVIVSVNQVEVRSAEDFERLAAARRTGPVGMIVRRNDADLLITLPRRAGQPGAQDRQKLPTGTLPRT